MGPLDCGVMTMKRGYWTAGALLALTGCGASEPPEQAARDQERVFAPLVGTVERAQGVQQTVDDQAAELRRRIEEQER
jgi:hypothetical protein